MQVDSDNVVLLVMVVAHQSSKPRPFVGESLAICASSQAYLRVFLDIDPTRSDRRAKAALGVQSRSAR
jgi:hypothetical protein